MKICRKCGTEKKITEFHKNKGNKDGHLNICKCCGNKCSARYKSENIEYIKISRARYYSEHREDAKDYNESYIKLYRKTDRFKLLKKAYEKGCLNAHKSRRYYSRHKNSLALPNNCQECEDTSKRLEAHHFDYNKPMEVTFLCGVCHMAWHKVNTPLNRVTGIFTRDKK